jgi:hypothetical protein
MNENVPAGMGGVAFGKAGHPLALFVKITLGTENFELNGGVD